MIFLLEICVFGVIAWPLLRAAIQPPLRRAFPRTAATMLFLVLSGIVAVVLLGLLLPRILHILTAAAIGVAVYGMWRARPSHGLSQRLPHGSLSQMPFDYLIDPYFFQKQIERHGFPFKVNQFGIGAGPNPFRGLLQPVCCVDLKRGIKILNNYDSSLTPPPIPSSRFIPKKYLREMKPEDHRVYRRLFSSAFTSDVIDESAAFAAEHFRSSLARMADKSSSNGNQGLAPESRLIEMTFGIFARCFLGIFPEDARFGRLQELVHVIDLTNRNDREVTIALEEFALILRRHACSVASSQNGFPDSFLGRIAVAAPDAFEDLSAIRNFIFIMHASWIDTAGLIVWLFKELCDHPEWRARIIEEGRPGPQVGIESASLRFVKETLRLRQSEYIYRKVIKDVPVDGFVVPKGWLLRVCVRESHRDPAVFENPNEFNPDRFLRRRYSREEYSTFGASRITCLGEHLTLTMGRIFVEALAATVQTSVLQDGPMEYRRWHWKPSSKWRVQISAVPS